MISRAARVPRICLACRSRLTQRSAAAGFRAVPNRDGFGQRRRFASDSDAKSVDIDAIIAQKFATNRQTARAQRAAETNKRMERVDSYLYDAAQDMDTSDGQEPSSSPNVSLLSLMKASEPSSTPTSLEETQEAPTSLQETYEAPTSLEETSETQTSLEETESESNFIFMDNEPRPRKPPKSNPFLNLMMTKSDAHHVPLSTSTLGAQAEAIVFDHFAYKIRKSKDAEEDLDLEPELEDDTFKHVDWASINPRDRHEVTDRKETWKNIEELRPDASSIGYYEYRALAEGLSTGFTWDQLTDFIRDGPDIPAPAVKLSDYRWIVKQTPWTPFRAIDVKALSSKQVQAHRIITQKWKVEIRDFQASLGQCYVWVDPFYFAFLRRGEWAFLRTAKRKLMNAERNENITTTSHECRINITSQKASTYTFLEQLDRWFQLVEEKPLPIGLLTKDIPSAAELRELEEITSTSLKLKFNSKKAVLNVSHINSRKPAEPGQMQNETKPDTVVRLLTTRGVRGKAEKVQFIPSLDKGAFISHSRETRSMNWRGKYQNWFRYVTPLGKRSEEDEAPAPLKLSRHAGLPTYSNRDLGKSIYTTATFGHVLHPAVSKTTKTITSAHRILHPITPHPAAFSAAKPDEGRSPTFKSTIIINFSPHVDRETDPDDIGPAVRLVFELNEATTTDDSLKLLENATFEAVVHDVVSDVLLGNQSVDIRLTNVSRIPLNPNQQDLRKFLQVSAFNLSGGRLQTPKDVRLNISKSWKKAKATDTSDDHVSILYDFRGIEIHQTVEMPWRENTLCYNLVEAGQHGGRRQEVSLKFGKPGFDPDFKGARREQYLRCVQDLASGKVWTWDSGHELVKASQYEDLSFDLPGEALGEGWDRAGRAMVRRSADYTPPREDARKSVRAAPRADTKKVAERAAAKAAAAKSAAARAAVAKAAAARAAVAKAAVAKDAVAKDDVVKDDVVKDDVVKDDVAKDAFAKDDVVKDDIAKEAVSQAEPPTEPKSTLGEDQFFKFFASRAGANLDQFKPISKSKQRKEKLKLKKEQEAKEKGEQKPQMAPATPRRETTPRDRSGAREPAYRETDMSRGSESSAAAWGGDFEEEWDEDDMEDLEDNEKTTEEIEAELIKFLGLDRPPEADLEPALSTTTPNAAAFGEPATSPEAQSSWAKDVASHEPVASSEPQSSWVQDAASDEQAASPEALPSSTEDAASDGPVTSTTPPSEVDDPALDMTEDKADDTATDETDDKTNDGAVDETEAKVADETDDKVADETNDKPVDKTEAKSVDETDNKPKE